MKRLIEFLRSKIITVFLGISAFLMLVSAVLIIVNRSIIDTAIETQATAEKAKYEFLFSYLNIVRHVDVALRGFAVIREERMLYIKPSQLRAEAQVVFNRLDSILDKQGYTEEEGLNALKEYEAYISLLVDDFEVMSNLLRNHNDSAFMAIFTLDKGSKLGISMKKAQEKVIPYEEALQKKAIEDYNKAMQTNIVVGIMMVLLGVPSVFMVIIRLQRQDKNQKALLKELETNNRKYVFDPGGEAQTTNEAQTIIQSSIIHFRQATDFVAHLSEGKLTARWDGLTLKNEPLNQVNLTGKLIQLQENLKAIKSEDEKRIWVNEGLARFSEIMRNNERNIKELSIEIVKFLTHYIKAEQGALFVLQDDTTPYLELSACYAFERRKFLEKRVEIGEGLIGQTYLEGETVFLKEVPDHYTSITSGLGEATPNCIVIVPMKYNNVTEAVFELASFHVFEKYQVNFLEKAGEFVASALLSTKTTQKMKSLLDLSQQQTETMRASEEELRQNMEEMNATQEEMARKEKEYLAVIETLRKEKQ